MPHTPLPAHCLVTLGISSLEGQRLTLQTPSAGLLSGLDWLPPQQWPLSLAAPSRGAGGLWAGPGQHCPPCPSLPTPGEGSVLETNTDYSSLNLTPTEEELSISARMRK